MVIVSLDAANEANGVALEQALRHVHEREMCDLRKRVSFIRVEGQMVVLRRRAASIVIQLRSAYCSEVSSISKSAAMDTTY
jgi:hypothetical protein